MLIWCYVTCCDVMRFHVSFYKMFSVFLISSCIILHYCIISKRVPLSNVNEDEWGWEDNARNMRDLELGGHRNSNSNSNSNINGHKEELNSVLASASKSGSERTLKANNFSVSTTGSGGGGMAKLQMQNQKPLQKSVLSSSTLPAKSSAYVRSTSATSSSANSSIPPRHTGKFAMYVPCRLCVVSI